MWLKGKRAVFRQILAGDPLEAQICYFEPAFFLMNSFCGLKANGPFSTKSWPGTLWKLKFAIVSLQITILKLIGSILKLKRNILRQK